MDSTAGVTTEPKQELRKGNRRGEQGERYDAGEKKGGRTEVHVERLCCGSVDIGRASLPSPLGCRRLATKAGRGLSKSGG